MDRPDEPRTDDLYEIIPGYAQPPVIPLPDLDDLSLFAAFKLKNNAFAHSLLNAGLSASGLRQFVHSQKPDDLEAILRVTNLRLPGLFAPVLSATAALLDDPRPLSPFQRAATLVFGVHSLYRSIHAAELEADRRRDQILEMGQYPNLFSTSLIIEGAQPRLFKSIFEPQITVLIAGRIYLVQLGELKTETWVEGLATYLQRLAESAQTLAADELAPGWLTAADSRTQVRIFNLLAADPAAAPNLRAMRRSFLTLCLDLDAHPETPAEAARLAHTANLSNRWFHSSLQLVVFANSRACSIMSFTAYLDGNTMMRGSAEIQSRASVFPLQLDVSPEAAPDFSIQELHWNLSPKTLPPALVQRARAEIAAVIDDTQPATFYLPGFGRDYFQTHQLPPIPAFILALQAAADRAARRPQAINQFVSLASYRCMDLTAANISTPPVQQFSQALNQPDSTNAEPSRLAELLNQALETQAAVVHKARQQLPVDVLLLLYMRTRQGAARRRARLALGASLFSLALLGQASLFPARDVIVSHPEIQPQVLVIGRPGARLNYVRSFGLHYQLWPDQAVLTFMPGLRWKTPNQEIVSLIQENLQKISAIIR